MSLFHFYGLVTSHLQQTVTLLLAFNSLHSHLLLLCFLGGPPFPLRIVLHGFQLFQGLGEPSSILAKPNKVNNVLLIQGFPHFLLYTFPFQLNLICGRPSWEVLQFPLFRIWFLPEIYQLFLYGGPLG